MTEPPPEKRRERDDRPERAVSGERAPRKTRDDLTTYRIAVGKRHRVGPVSSWAPSPMKVACTATFGTSPSSPTTSVELPAALSRETRKLRGHPVSPVLIDIKPDDSRGLG